jgi:hypothetical protein
VPLVVRDADPGPSVSRRLQVPESELRLLTRLVQSGANEAALHYLQRLQKVGALGPSNAADGAAVHARMAHAVPPVHQPIGLSTLVADDDEADSELGAALPPPLQDTPVTTTDEVPPPRSPSHAHQISPPPTRRYRPHVATAHIAMGPHHGTPS